MHKSSKVAVALATIGLTLAACSSAEAGGKTQTVSTSAIIPPADGYLSCKVTADSRTRIEIVATIISDAGTDVTEFSSGFRASPAATGDGRYHAEETAGSLDDDARSCTATVKGASRRDVHVTLTAYGADDKVIATVEGR